MSEWCWDRYEADYPSGPVTDPIGAASGAARVARGGNWDINSLLCRSAQRWYYEPQPGRDKPFRGLRPARTKRDENPKMEFIKAGTFTMGSPVGELGRLDDEIQHEVTLTKDFYLAAREVSQADWVSVMGTNPSEFGGCHDCPVETVNWHDAVEYYNRRSTLEGLASAYEVNGTNVTWRRSANGYRLPTEAE